MKQKNDKGKFYEWDEWKHIQRTTTMTSEEMVEYFLWNRRTSYTWWGIGVVLAFIVGTIFGMGVCI